MSLKEAGFEGDKSSIPNDRHNTLNKLFPSRTTSNPGTLTGGVGADIDKGIALPQYNPKKERRASYAPVENAALPPPSSPPKRRRSSVAPFTATEEDEARIAKEREMLKVVAWRWDIIHPHGKFRYYWDMNTLAMMLWVVIDVPFMVAFDVPVDVNKWDWHRVLSLMVDVFFMFDVVLNFNTGVEIGGVVSMDRIVIAKDYVKSWFWIDIVSAFPLDLVLSENDSGSANSTQVIKLAKMGRVVRMFKLIRLLRIARIMRVVSRLEYTMSTQEAMRTLWKFFAVVVICCHLFSCAFYAIGVEYNGPDEWANGVDGSLDTIFAKYVACFYWAIMTTTTIGYGDVSSSGTAQQLFGMLAMLIGALLFGYGVSNVVNIVEELRSGERQFREKMDKFNRYMRSQNFPADLQDSIRDYLKNVKRVQSERVSVEDEIGLLSQLSLGLRERIAVAVNDIYLRDMPFFAGEDPSVVMELAFCMERCCVGPDEDVIRIDDEGHEMYFVLEGRVEVLVMKRGLLSPIAVIGKEEFFGEMALLQPGHIRTANIRTLTFCEFRVLSADAFNVIASRYPMFGRSLKSIVRDRKSLRSSDCAIEALMGGDADDLEPDDMPPDIAADTAANNAANKQNTPSKDKIITNKVSPFAAVENHQMEQIYDQKPLPTRNGGGDNLEETKDETESADSYKGQLKVSKTVGVPHGGPHLSPIDPSAVVAPTVAASPGAITPTSPIKPWSERAVNTPGPLTSPLKDTSTMPSRAGGGEHMEKQYTEALQSIFNLVVNLKEQQKDFSNNIIHRMDMFDTDLNKLRTKVERIDRNQLRERTNSDHSVAAASIVSTELKGCDSDEEEGGKGATAAGAAGHTVFSASVGRNDRSSLTSIPIPRLTASFDQKAMS